jgi:hypothetical protein
MTHIALLYTTLVCHNLGLKAADDAAKVHVAAGLEGPVVLVLFLEHA